MKIVHISKYLPEFAGGVEQVTRAMAQAGMSAKASVEIVGLAPRKRESLIQATAGVVEVPLHLHFHVGSLPIAPAYFKESLRAMSADLVHVHLPNPVAELALLTVLLAHRGKRPFIVPVIHAPICHWRGLGNLWERSFQQELLDRADRVIISSRNLLECMRWRGTRLSDEKTIVIPNGVSPPVPGRARERSPGDPFRFLVITRLVPYKGLDVLIDAAVAVPGDWTLTIVGLGPEAPSLKTRVRQRGLEGRVTFMEGTDEETKHRLLDEHDLLILPSLTVAEAYGMVLVEAFSHAKPVIVTDLPTGVAYLARKGECGAVVRAGSVDAMGSAMTRLMRDHLTSDAAGKANHAFWRRELTRSAFERHYWRFLAAHMAGAEELSALADKEPESAVAEVA